MKKIVFLILFVLGFVWANGACGEEPSWYSFQSDSLEIHVANVIRNGDKTVKLSKFAASAGKMYAKQNDQKHQEFLVLPVLVMDCVSNGIVLEKGKVEFYALVGRKTVKATDAMWVDGPIYPREGIDPPTTQSLVTFPKSFRLKDVTGFTMVLRGREYQLQLESKLQ